MRQLTCIMKYDWCDFGGLTPNNAVASHEKLIFGADAWSFSWAHHLGMFEKETDAGRVAKEAREAQDKGEWERYYAKIVAGLPKVWNEVNLHDCTVTNQAFSLIVDNSYLLWGGFVLQRRCENQEKVAG